MLADREHTGRRWHWPVVAALGLTTCLAIVGCSGSATEESAAEPAPSVTVTTTEEPEPPVEPETTPEDDRESSEQPLAITEAEWRQLLLTSDDLLRAGDFPKGPFDEQVQVQPGAQAYATFDSVVPAEYAGLVQGPFAGTAPDPGGPIIGSASVFFIEGEVAYGAGRRYL